MKITYEAWGSHRARQSMEVKIYEIWKCNNNKLFQNWIHLFWKNIPSVWTTLCLQGGSPMGGTDGAAADGSWEENFEIIEKKNFDGTPLETQYKWVTV